MRPAVQSLTEGAFIYCAIELSWNLSAGMTLWTALNTSVAPWWLVIGGCVLCSVHGYAFRRDVRTGGGDSHDGSRSAAILVVDAGYTSVRAARLRCENCDGFEGLVCPRGCGVHLVDVQAEKDEEFRERMRAEEAERQARRAERRGLKKKTDNTEATAS